MTFSIVALDPDTGDLSVAVQSRFLAVGAVVPWARAGIGAIATQSFANVRYGRQLALEDWMAVENLEERSAAPGWIDERVLAILRGRRSR